MATTTLVATIREAIKNLHQITCTVNGHPRVACPHILGTKGGDWHVLVWQINDAGEHGFKAGDQRWRCYELEDMENLKVQKGEWHRGWEKGKKKSSCVDTIDTVVDPAHAAVVQNTSP